MTRRIALLAVMLLMVSLAWAQAPDPAGIATGDKTNVVDAGGNAFVVSEPTDKTAPDYAEKKKAFDEFQAQVAKEPLAMKLADAVGHVRIGTNFAWTLNTGYLVLFMQAGFALLTCGLVRKKNAGHLMMLNFAAYVFAFGADKKPALENLLTNIDLIVQPAQILKSLPEAYVYNDQVGDPS